jgi:hypothetical protein
MNATSRNPSSKRIDRVTVVFFRFSGPWRQTGPDFHGTAPLAKSGRPVQRLSLGG